MKYFGAEIMVTNSKLWWRFKRLKNRPQDNKFPLSSSTKAMVRPATDSPPPLPCPPPSLSPSGGLHSSHATSARRVVGFVVPWERIKKKWSIFARLVSASRLVHVKAKTKFLLETLGQQQYDDMHYYAQPLCRSGKAAASTIHGEWKFGRPAVAGELFKLKMSRIEMNGSRARSATALLR